MHLVFTLGAIMMTQPTEQVARPSDSPITIVETGVARTYEATKKISCGNVEWRVHWESGPEPGQIRGSVTVAVAGQSKTMPDAQSQIFGKFESIDGVSATCNEGAEGEPVRSALLVRGSVGNSKKAMAQVYIEPDLQTSVSFNAID